mgnify:CR=1 FL=1
MTMDTRKTLAAALAASMLLGALPGVALAQDAEDETTPEGVEWMLDTLAGEAVPAEASLHGSGPTEPATPAATRSSAATSSTVRP